jgi:hypothetical protein
MVGRALVFPVVKILSVVMALLGRAKVKMIVHDRQLIVV